jgi:hypothetical protein
MAQIPQIIDYQGRLADSEGNYLNSVVTVEFSIYGFETGGTAMWSETQDVNCANGVFHIQLGSVTPFPVTLFNFAAPWLELIVGGETLVPRTKISSVPYAIKAETAYSLNFMGSGSGLDADLLDGLDSSDFADAAHTHNHDALPGYVALEHTPLNDADTTETNLWSAQKTFEEILSKQDKIARYSDEITGFVDSIGPDTGFPFVFTIIDSDFVSATSDEIDVTVTGFTGPNSTTIEEPLVFYHEVVKIGDNFYIKIYIKGYDKTTWGAKYIKIHYKAIYIK